MSCCISPLALTMAAVVPPALLQHVFEKSELQKTTKYAARCKLTAPPLQRKSKWTLWPHSS